MDDGAVGSLTARDGPPASKAAVPPSCGGDGARCVDRSGAPAPGPDRRRAQAPVVKGPGRPDAGGAAAVAPAPSGVVVELSGIGLLRTAGEQLEVGAVRLGTTGRSWAPEVARGEYPFDDAVLQGLVGLHHEPPSHAQAVECSGQARSRTSSSALTAMRSAWKVRLAGCPPLRRAGAGTA